MYPSVAQHVANVLNVPSAVQHVANVFNISRVVQHVEVKQGTHAILTNTHTTEIY